MSKRALLAIAALSMLTACSDASTSDGGGPGVDAKGVDMPGDVDPLDDAPGPLKDASGLPEPGELGYPCENNTDCNSGFCVEGPEGYICTKTCEEECPEGYDCKGVSTGTVDVTFLCMPKVLKLCAPCQLDIHCNQGACLAIAEGKFCAPPCEAAQECPTGYACEADPHGRLPGAYCQPVTGSCSCHADIDGGLRTCSVANDVGQCFGVETCDQELGWVDCTAAPAELETCDGLDEDCNGLVDDGLTDGAACEIAVDGIGSCSGQKVCLGSAGWICQAKTPSLEACDHKDNDCDGAVDEDFKLGDLYTDFDHCGACNTSCAVGFPNAATTECAVLGGVPQCIVTGCLAGFIKLNDFQCIAEAASLCQPCSGDATCLGETASCLSLPEGSYCGKACSDASDCPEGYACDAVEGAPSSQCVPVTQSCTCSGANEGLARACVATWVPADPTQPSTTCQGFEYCSDAGWGDCVPPDEVCDGLDNDCDGVLDEDFKDAQGQLASVTHCGGCAISCVALAFPHAQPTCDTSGPLPTCAYVCDGGWIDVDKEASNGCECSPQPGADLPDVDGLDSDCDGVDGETDDGIFVSKAGDDGNPGTMDAPLVSITEGIARAISQDKRDVYVATGVYVGTVVLADGVGVYGGYSADFAVRDTVAYQTAILGDQPTAAAPGAVLAVDVGHGAATVLDGFSVFGDAGSVSMPSSCGIYMRDVGSQLSVTHNVIWAGDGAPGTPGTSSASGANGVDGDAGVGGTNVGSQTCTAADQAAGGEGGAHGCGATDVTGGVGGMRICPEAPDQVQTAAQVSQDVEYGGDGAFNAWGSGAGGEPGWDLLVGFSSCGVCSSNNDHPGDGLDGGAGFEGYDGLAAAACSDGSGHVDAGGHWQPWSAGTGDPGWPGGGGGGGGAAGGVDIQSWCTAYGKAVGGSGGGGGSGGCEGLGGLPGVGGGGSFGLFATWSNPPGVLPTVAGNLIYRGAGGQGGSGGAGGLGGAGGQGGTGGPTGQGQGSFPIIYCGSGGGYGGPGGSGGHGAGGGGGCGGVSYGAYVQGAGAANVAAAFAQNTYPTTGQAGAGGAGGSSYGNPGPAGSDGVYAATSF